MAPAKHPRRVYGNHEAGISAPGAMATGYLDGQVTYWQSPGPDGPNRGRAAKRRDRYGPVPGVERMAQQSDDDRTVLVLVHESSCLRPAGCGVEERPMVQRGPSCVCGASPAARAPLRERFSHQRGRAANGVTRTSSSSAGPHALLAETDAVAGAPCRNVVRGPADLHGCAHAASQVSLCVGFAVRCARLACVRR